MVPYDSIQGHYSLQTASEVKSRKNLKFLWKSLLEDPAVGGGLQQNVSSQTFDQEELRRHFTIPFQRGVACRPSPPTRRRRRGTSRVRLRCWRGGDSAGTAAAAAAAAAAECWKTSLRRQWRGLRRDDFSSLISCSVDTFLFSMTTGVNIVYATQMS